MRENSDERRSQSHQDRRLPYNQQDWNRRLAVARARRAATLRRLDAQHEAAASPSERLAAAWDGDRDALAVVTTPVAAPPAKPAATVAEPVSETAAELTEPDPVVESPRGPASFSPAVTLIAGCLIGASLTGLVFLATSPADRRPADTVASAGAVSAAASDPRVAEPADLAAPAHADAIQPPASVTRPAVATGRDSAARSVTEGVAPVTEQRSAARTDGTPSGNSSAPAAVTAPARTPAATATRQLGVPGTINAPQILSPTDILPKAPASIERVVVLAPRSVSQAGREEAAALLREAGWPARDPATSPFTISRTHVRYYHEDDRAGAEELATLFSAEARSFTSYTPRPEEGMIELWLAGRAPPRPAAHQQGPSLARFLGRLAAALELRD